MSRLTPHNPLDLPEIMGLSTALDLHTRAERLFEATFGDSLTLESDLAASAELFDPVAQGQRLRRTIAQIVSPREHVEKLPSSWKFNLPGGRVVLTPEGISAMHALRSAIATKNQDLLLRPFADAALNALLAQYRQWNRHRLSGVVRLLDGEDKPLQLQGIGALLTLLINGNVGPSRALTRANNRALERRQVIDSAFFAAVHSFTVVVAPSSKIKSGGDRLISGWYLGEIARRLPGLVLSQPSEAGDGAVYLDEGSIDPAVDLIARDLSRGNRKRPTLDTLGAAFDGMVEAFLSQRSALASFGELHESPSQTRLLRDRVLTAYELRQHVDSEIGE